MSAESTTNGTQDRTRAFDIMREEAVFSCAGNGLLSARCPTQSKNSGYMIAFRGFLPLIAEGIGTDAHDGVDGRCSPKAHISAGFVELRVHC